MTARRRSRRTPEESSRRWITNYVASGLAEVAAGIAPPPPAGWREGHDGSLACPHRDCSVCPTCAEHPCVLEVYGRHFWVTDPAERAELRAQMTK